MTLDRVLSCLLGTGIGCALLLILDRWRWRRHARRFNAWRKDFGMQVIGWIAPLEKRAGDIEERMWRDGKKTDNRTAQ